MIDRRTAGSTFRFLFVKLLLHLGRAGRGPGRPLEITKKGHEGRRARQACVENFLCIKCC